MLILNIVTFANLFFLFCLLFFRRNSALPNKILALILLTPGIIFLSNVNVLSGHFADLPYIFFFAQITSFLIAPLVHIYVHLLIGRKINYRHPLYIISALATLMVVFFAAEFALLPDGMQHTYLQGVMHEPYPWQMDFTNTLFILLQQIYFTLAAIDIYRYRRSISEIYSNFEKTRVKFATIFIGLIWLLNLIATVSYLTLSMTQVEYVILPLVVTIIYFFILYFSFTHNSVFTHQSYAQFVAENAEDSNDSAGKAVSPLMDAELIVLAQRIEDHLTAKESYTNPDLTLEVFSKEMDLPDAKISAAINKGLKKNFYDLINEKRVMKSKISLRDRANEFTIEYIAYESGFNSRASFYRAFKKHTGITPTEFLRDIVA